jgi:hypothetical protein
VGQFEPKASNSQTSRPLVCEGKFSAKAHKTSQLKPIESTAAYTLRSTDLGGFGSSFRTLNFAEASGKLP